MKRAKWLGIPWALLAAGGALAHHGWSGYDSERTLTLTGTILESGYENPHGYVELQTQEGQRWHVVLAPPARMERRGLPAEALAPGGEATVEGYPHRTDPDELRAERITLGERTVELR